MAAAVQSGIPTYKRHRPELGIVYRVVQTYWPKFLQEQGKVGKAIPHFIADEFEEFLKCGIPEFGVVRTYCYQCRYSGVVAFSCKRRGFCPSCAAKRMNDEAAHLVDKVLPQITYRQWVISFPYKLRYQMAYNSKLTSKILSAYIQIVSSHYGKKARRMGIKASKPGVVTFIQRFGSALNLNVHFHALFADGVFYKTSDGYEFLRLPAPTQEELFELATRIQVKTLAIFEKMGLNETDQTDFDENLLGEISKISIQQKSAYGDRAGVGIRRYGIKRLEFDSESCDPLSANVEGFSLNASVWISGKDETKLEKLIRYMARGPIATERLTESFPNQLLYKMKSRWRDGTTHLSFSPLDFIARLVALIPPPRMNMIRYHGVFAPNFKDRAKLIKRGAGNGTVLKSRSCEGSTEKPSQAAKRERLRWGEMLKRVFEIDVTVCPRCKGRLEQIAVIKDKTAITSLLENLGEQTVFSPLRAEFVRGPPEAGSESEFDFDQSESW